MHINEAGLDIIKHFEKFEPKPYLCPAGVPTIGYGATYYEDGKKVTLNDPPITHQRALELLRHLVITFENYVKKYVKVNLTSNQFSALVSFVFNIGPYNFKQSTLLKKLNSEDFTGAALEFDRWIYASGKPLKGLKLRREAERGLFTS